VALELNGLQPSTTYYYRIVGTNVDSREGSESQGEVHEFTTTAYPNPNITVEELRVLHEPFTAWPASTNGIFPSGGPEKAAPKRCKKGFAKKHGKCVRKKKHKHHAKKRKKK
jgi:hypothetical protein